MQIRKAERTKAKIKLAIEGPSGSGKTYSSLLIAKGLANQFNKVCIIDSENNSADLYAHLGDYNVISISDPFSPEKYIEAIQTAEKAGMEVIIIDSLSHAWEYLVEFHANLSGNSFANWGKVTPRQRKLIQKILSSSSHIIATMRVKQDYVLTENKKGKLEPQKVGLKSVQRDGVDYEFTIVFRLDHSNFASTTKDRTGQFWNTPDFKITEETGQTVRKWCESGTSVDNIRDRISETKSLQELLDLYKQNPKVAAQFQEDFSQRREELAEQSINSFKPSQNGTIQH